MDFLNSSFFSALITLFVGLTAFILYVKKVNDNKRTVSKIIWLEIKATEERVDDIRRNSLNHNTKPVLRNNSWIENRHFIISHFDSDEIKMITVFYDVCENIELLRQQIIDSHIQSMHSKAAAVQNELVSMMKTELNFETVNAFKKNYCDLGEVFSPSEPFRLVQIEFDNIRYLTGSSAAEKLKKLSKIS